MQKKILGKHLKIHSKPTLTLREGLLQGDRVGEGQLGMEHTLAVWVLITVLSSIAKKNAVGLSAIDKTKWVIKVKLLCICDDNFLAT